MYFKKEVLNDLNYRMQVYMEQHDIRSTLNTDQIVDILTEYIDNLKENDELS